MRIGRGRKQRVLWVALAGTLVCGAQPTVSAAAAPKAGIVRNELASGGQKRSYYLFVPESVRPESPAPLLVTLHGQGRNGRILVEEWKDLASKEGIILAGPDALGPMWNLPRDGPDFLHDVVEEIRSKYPVDSRRIYLFGHSAGGSFGIFMALMESEYFAGLAASAGALRLPKEAELLDYATRKIPIALFIGTQDALVPLKFVRETRDAMQQKGIPVEVTEIKGHTHDYYSRSKQINQDAWAFLKSKVLERDPQYTRYH